VGRLALALGKKASPPRQIPRVCPRAVEGRRATAAPVSPSALPRWGVWVRGHSSRKLVPPRRELTAMRALVPPPTRPHASDRPTSLRAKSQPCWGHVSCSQGVLWPNGAAAKGGAGRAIWGLEGPGSRASPERFAGKTPDRWQSTGAAATCRGAPLPCRGATAIPACNPGPADPNCRTVP